MESGTILDGGRVSTEALFSAASRTLLALGEQRLGGQLGITTVLHTWSSRGTLHPHTHLYCSVEDRPLFQLHSGGDNLTLHLA